MGGNPNSTRGIRGGTGSNRLENRTNNCGGHKKQGIPSTVGKRRQLVDAIKSNAQPTTPFFISNTNVLSGGVGRYQSMFRAPADGVNVAALNADRARCSAACSCQVTLKVM
jgi:hypothetical protein